MNLFLLGVVMTKKKKNRKARKKAFFSRDLLWNQHWNQQSACCVVTTVNNTNILVFHQSVDIYFVGFVGASVGCSPDKVDQVELVYTTTTTSSGKATLSTSIDWLAKHDANWSKQTLWRLHNGAQPIHIHSSFHFRFSLSQFASFLLFIFKTFFFIFPLFFSTWRFDFSF